jgi:hypothetical protein
LTRVAAAALALALLGGADGCCACQSQLTFERFGPATPGPAPTLTPPVLRVLHFGDFGEPTCQQASVASGIADAQRRKPFDLAIHIGDNLYPCGPDWFSTQASRCTFAPDGNTVTPGYVPPDDPGFRDKFEHPLAELAAAGVPLYLGLGNHDIMTTPGCVPVGDPVAVSRTKACLELAHKSPLWNLPARHYVLDRGPARFIFIDGNLIDGDYGGFTLQEEVDFLAASTVGCDAMPCFVLSHHPAAAAGQHAAGFTQEFRSRVQALETAAGGRIRAWVSGHDHDLQHLRTAGGLDVFISGNGCRDRPSERFTEVAPAGATLLYGTVRWGYAILEVSATGFTWRVEDDSGTPRYCCAATLSGTWSRCEPVRCD